MAVVPVVAAAAELVRVVATTVPATTETATLAFVATAARPAGTAECAVIVAGDLAAKPVRSVG